MKTTTKPTNSQIITRAVWLAFKASSPMGMGFLHAAQADGVTEEQLASLARETDKGIEVRTDYVCGRMMKTTFTVSPDGKLTVWPEVPRHDYQSWAGDYATAAELIAAVEKSFA